jgi:serine/threonine protein kinase
MVKLARPHQCIDPRARASLAREVAALHHNPHPVLPTLVSDASDDEIPHIVTEYIDGPPLSDIVDDEPMDAGSAAMLGIHLLAALTTLHRRNIAHLDVKPDNVVVRDWRPVLVDFGSARTTGSVLPAGQRAGTSGYRAPELEACEPISTAMDIYGVGATLREAFSGYSVYDNDPERRRMASQPPYPPGHPTLVALIATMLSERPSERPTIPEGLDAFADLFDPATRPWPPWLSARQPPPQGDAEGPHLHQMNSTARRESPTGDPLPAFVSHSRSTIGFQDQLSVTRCI